LTGAQNPAKHPAMLTDRYHDLATHRLDDTRRAEFGIDPDWHFGIERRARWSEMDPFRHVNHATYFEWYEEARNLYLETLGLPPLAPDVPGPVLAETTAKYVKPLIYGDVVMVTARTASMGRTSLVMEYAVWKDGCAASGRGVIVLVVNDTGEKTPIPDGLRAAITDLEGRTF